MLHLQGSVVFSELGAIPTGPVPVGRRDEFASLTLPGIDLRWRHGVVDFAQNSGVLVLAAGRARDSLSEPAGEAARWTERYTRLGDRAPVDVGGGFAVSIVDLAKRRVLLFVDRFSIETLCYRAGNGKVEFADSACDVPGANGAILPQAIYDYLYFHVIPGPETVFAEVRRLEPANQLTCDRDAVVTRRYWEPAFVEDDARDLAERLRRFIQVVKHSVEEEADEPATACFLSGGTDSSTVAGLLTQLRGSPTHAYSIGFEAEGYDEMEYARLAARHFGLVHHEYYITPDDLVRAIPEVAASFDQPFGNSSLLPAYYCALKAKEGGFARILAGDGGDEVFGGNTRYALQKLFEPYQLVPRGIRRGLETAANKWRAFRNVPGLRQLGGYVRHAQLPMPERLETFNLLNRLGADVLLEPSFRKRVDPKLSRDQQQITWNAVSARSLTNRMLAYDWKYTLADSDLPKVRGAAQLAGIEVGYPFLGRLATDFSLSLPPEWKVRGLTLRWLFKRALHGFLPVEILRKKKHGFGLPFGHWMLQHAGLQRLATDSLDGIARRGIIRPQFTREVMRDRLREAPGYYGEMVWILMMLEQWFRTHESSSKSFPAHKTN